MPMMTAEQAAEAGKSLTFEKVWAMFVETDKKFAETDKKFAETDKKFAETGKKFAEVAEQFKETDKRFDERMTRLEKNIDRVTENINGVNRSMGKWAEQMVATNLWEKFKVLGYEFTKGGPNMKFRENGQRIAEVDVFLENGEFVMPVETKTDLTIEDINEHIERIETIRAYMDNHSDQRIIVGAVAGAIVPDNVCRYAQKKGLYVLVQSGDSIAVAEMPKEFNPKKW